MFFWKQEGYIAMQAGSNQSIFVLQGLENATKECLVAAACLFYAPRGASPLGLLLNQELLS